MSDQDAKMKSVQKDSLPKDKGSWQEELADIGDTLSGAFDQLRFYIYSAILVLLLLAGFFWNRILVIVAAGNHAVLYDIFRGGTQTDKVYDEGIHFILPWNKMISYETRLQQKTVSFKVLSEEGLELGVTLAIRYSPVVPNLAYLHREIGPDYFERLIKPEVEGHLRNTFGARPANQIYASAREVLQEITRVPLLERVMTPGGPGQNLATAPYVRLEELKLVGIELPSSLATAINDKQRQEQLTLEYKYRLQREEKEAERKRIEATGIRDSNLIARKLSTDLLRWRSIDATENMAKSNNAKVVVLGGGQQGMPLMLNFTDQPMSSGNAAPAASSTPSPAPAPALAPKGASAQPPAPAAKPAPSANKPTTRPHRPAPDTQPASAEPAENKPPS